MKNIIRYNNYPLRLGHTYLVYPTLWTFHPYNHLLWCLPYLKELFTKIDLEDDGVVYLKEIVLYLRAMNEDIDSSLKV